MTAIRSCSIPRPPAWRAPPPARQNYGISLLSPFIPENPVISKTGQITIKKETPLFISDGKEFGLFINYLSAKNVHIEYIYIPIYKEEI